jgi:hypothetical protein
MDPKRQIYADFDSQVDAATAAWNRVALGAWRGLRKEDPELADLALSLFGAEEEAAHWFARRQRGVTCYGRLAIGDREGIRQQLAAAQYGFCA